MNTGYYDFYLKDKTKLTQRLKDHLERIIYNSERGKFWISEDNKKISENFIKEISGEEWINKDNIDKIKKFLETIHIQDKINSKEVQPEKILKFWRFRFRILLHEFTDNSKDGSISEIQVKNIVDLLCSGKELTRGSVNYCLDFIPLQQLLLYISEKLN